MRKRLSNILRYTCYFLLGYICLNYVSHYENEVNSDGFYFSRGHNLFGRKTYSKDFASGRELLEVRDGFGNQTQIEFDSQNNLVSSVFKFKQFLLLRQPDNSVLYSRRLSRKVLPFKTYESEFSSAHELRDRIRQGFSSRIGKEPKPTMPKPQFDLPTDFNDSIVPYIDDGFDRDVPPPPDIGEVPPPPEEIK